MSEKLLPGPYARRYKADNHSSRELGAFPTGSASFAGTRDSRKVLAFSPLRLLSEEVEGDMVVTLGVASVDAGRDSSPMILVVPIRYPPACLVDFLKNPLLVVEVRAVTVQEGTFLVVVNLGLYHQGVVQKSSGNQFSVERAVVVLEEVGTCASLGDESCVVGRMDEDVVGVVVLVLEVLTVVVEVLVLVVDPVVVDDGWSATDAVTVMCTGGLLVGTISVKETRALTSGRIVSVTVAELVTSEV
mgnify:CR=1 FL=1